MKKFRKIFSVMLIVALMLSLSVSVFADTETSSFDPVKTIFQTVQQTAETVMGNVQSGTQEETAEDNEQVQDETTDTQETATSESNDADAKYEPGTYTVTANIYIAGTDNTILNGTTAYITNSAVPPLSPVSDNAKLEVTDDGDLYLTIEDLNDVIALQSISSGSGVTVIETYKQTNNNVEYINGLKMQLLNDSGSYSFTNCVENPTILNKQFSLPLQMTVDFSNLKKGYTKPATSQTTVTDSSDSETKTVEEIAAAVADNEETEQADSTTFIDKVKSVVTTVFKTITGKIKSVFAAESDNDTADTSETETANTISSKYEAGTYTVTANIYIDGTDNTILNGTTAYITNSDVPPLSPVSDNAKLEVTDDGELYLTIDDLNDVIALQSIDSGSGVKVIETYKKTQNDVEYINGLKMQLLNDSGSYSFTNCVENPTILNKQFSLPLHMTVDLSDLKKGYTASEETSDSSTSGTESTTADTESTAEVAKTEIETTSEGTLKAGTYTVSANIWISSSASGLPMNPHLTNGSFPPKDPVSNNATLVVDSNGKGTLTIPITIQSKVMTVKSISGLDIVSSKSNGSGLTSITVNMGVISASKNSITKSCTANVSLGDLAVQMTGFSKDHSWPATLEMDFKGLPNSGSGELTEEQQEMIDEANAEAEEDNEDGEEKSNTVSSTGKLDKPASASSGIEDITTGEWVGAGVIVLALAALLIARKKKKNGKK